MVVQHLWGLFSHPIHEWKAIRNDACSVSHCYIHHVLLLAAIPPIAGFIGTTQVGWQLGSEVMKLTMGSAGGIALLFYLVMLVGVYSMGYMIHWMGKTYQADQSLARCVVFAAYTATPLFVVGITALYPLLWLNMLIGILALSHTVYLLYTGLPIMMGISEERGFLFSTAVLAVGLVTLVALLAITVLLWGMGFSPMLTS